MLRGFEEDADMLRDCRRQCRGLSAPQGDVVERYAFAHGVAINYSTLRAVANNKSLFKEVGGRLNLSFISFAVANIGNKRAVNNNIFFMKNANPEENRSCYYDC